MPSITGNGTWRLCPKIESDCREVDGLPVALSVSIGVSECQPTDSVESLGRRADKAMYRAKRAGGNRMAAPESEAG